MYDDDQKQGANHEPIQVDLQICKSTDVSLLYWKNILLSINLLFTMKYVWSTEDPQLFGSHPKVEANEKSIGKFWAIYTVRHIDDDQSWWKNVIFEHLHVNATRVSQWQLFLFLSLMQWWEYWVSMMTEVCDDDFDFNRDIDHGWWWLMMVDDGWKWWQNPSVQGEQSRGHKGPTH